MSAALLDDVRALLAEAIDVYRDTPQAARLRGARERIEEPLRVAIAGKMKAGKSTLLNALVGEQLAPTDEGECTRIVTWYCDSHTSRVTLQVEQGEAEQVPFRRHNGALEVDLGTTPVQQVERLVVEWPSEWLRHMALIDTPGIDSLSTDISQRTHAFLTPDEEEETPADAVLYLMRHLHGSDIRFLEAFHDDRVSQASPVNTIGVLSRADEIGSARPDAMDSARQIAERYRDDPRVRRLCQTVVPVAGLLAETAATLRQDEFRSLEVLATADPVEIDKKLISADRFVRHDAAIDLAPGASENLLARLGLFGVRLAVHKIRSGEVDSAPELAEALVRASGLTELRDFLVTQFAQRRDVLKARVGLLAVEGALRDLPLPGTKQLSTELERIESSAHEFAELRLLNALRAGWIELPDGDAGKAERLLGADGGQMTARIGLPADAPQPEIVGALSEALRHWQNRSEHPALDRTAVNAARVLVRTCEGLLTRVVPGPPPSS